MISIYSSTENQFSNIGIKVLKPIQAIITKEDNGKYEIDLKDTIENIDYYQEGLIIRVPTPWGYQGFRLTNPKKANRFCTCKGYHLYFDTSRYLIWDSYVVDKNCNDALDHLNNACDAETPFTFISDIQTVASYRCIRHTLEEAIALVIERWGGHLVRDNYNIAIRNTIGEDRGVTLRYGVNIQTTNASEKWDDVVTKILPVGKDGITLPERYITLEEDLYDIPYSKIVHFDQDNITEEDYTDESGNFDEESYQNDLIRDLRSKATEHLQTNKLPKVNYSLNAYIKNVSDIGDVIYVNHPKCKIDITTTVIGIEYDCIREQYTKIEFGNFKEKLENLRENIISSVTSEVSSESNEKIAKLQRNLETATNRIRSAMSDSFVIYDGNKIMVVDSLPAESARNVILINNGGIGFGQNGINGTFKSAWTIDGTLDMQQINVINLVADMIKGGTLKLGSVLNESGKMELYDEANRLICLADKTGLTVYCEDGTYVKLNPEVGFAGYDSQDNKIYWVDGDEFHQKKSVVEEEITIASKLREIPITITENGRIVNDGIGFVALV